MSFLSRTVSLFDPRFDLFQHDSTIQAFLQALGMWDGSVPPYSSALIVELHETAPQNFVLRFLFKNDTNTNIYGPPVQMQAKGLSF